MRFDEQAGKILLGVREWVGTARRGVCGAAPFDEDEPELSEGSRAARERLLPAGKAVDLARDFAFEDLVFRITGRASDYSEGTLTFFAETHEDPNRPTRAELAEARGIAYALAYLAGAEDRPYPCRLQLILCQKDAENTAIRTERVTVEKIDAFFRKCAAEVARFAAPEIERITRRVPSMRALKFPYGKMRAGQQDFIREAYRTFSRGGTLFASAPTGTGKTVSALFPAIRAMGDGRCDKIFYFTPKTTTAKAAEECILRMVEKNAQIRACLLSAKERICERGTVCREGKALCPMTKDNRLADAALALWRQQLPVATAEVFRAAARECGACPYELSLTYAELCDVIVCDLNYLFDPHVYIRRFFSARGRYAFLIDEAHNLPDRAREMYSAEMGRSFLLSPTADGALGAFSDLRETAEAAANTFSDILYPYLKDEVHRDRNGREVGGTHLSELPPRLFTLAESLTKMAEEEIRRALTAKDEEKSLRLRFLRGYLHVVKHFYETLLRFDGNYRLFLFLENEELRAKLFCLDPSARIAERLALGESALFFSGTLSPLNYYRATLGGDRTSSMLAVGTPFDKDNLCIAVMDGIGTRLAQRENTLLALCRAILTVISAKAGNYIVYSPSFAYSDALCKQFCAISPKTRVLNQTQGMTTQEKNAFLNAFSAQSEGTPLVGFCVMGGIYAEGIDLAGDRLIGAVVVGIGLPALSYEREAIAEYYDEKYEMGKAFAYLYPGMNRVFQAAGRVIRTETDRGVIVLIDDRFDDPLYRKAAPDLFSGMKFFSETKALQKELEAFWQKGERAAASEKRKPKTSDCPKTE